MRLLPASAEMWQTDSSRAGASLVAEGCHAAASSGQSTDAGVKTSEIVNFQLSANFFSDFSLSVQPSERQSCRTQVLFSFSLLKAPVCHFFCNCLAASGVKVAHRNRPSNRQGTLYGGATLIPLQGSSKHGDSHEGLVHLM